MSCISFPPNPPPQIIIKRPLSVRQHETIVSKMYIISPLRESTPLEKNNSDKKATQKKLRNENMTDLDCQLYYY